MLTKFVGVYAEAKEPENGNILSCEPSGSGSVLVSDAMMRRGRPVSLGDGVAVVGRDSALLLGFGASPPF